MNDIDELDDELMTEPQVRAFFGGISHTTTWRWEQDGRLPKPIKIGSRMKRYRKSLVREAKARMMGGIDAWEKTEGADAA